MSAAQGGGRRQRRGEGTGSVPSIEGGWRECRRDEGACRLCGHRFFCSARAALWIELSDSLPHGGRFAKTSAHRHRQPLAPAAPAASSPAARRKYRSAPGAGPAPPRPGPAPTRSDWLSGPSQSSLTQGAGPDAGGAGPASGP